MTRDFDRGSTLPIPCRHCGRFIPFRVEEGTSSIACTGCGRVTAVTVKRKGSEWIITSSPVQNGKPVDRRP